MTKSSSTNNRQFTPMRNSAEALESAISNLIDFAHKGNPSTLSRVGKFILSTFSSRARLEREHDKLEARTAVLQAITTIKSHYPLITELKKGNLKEKKLADSILSAITQYHTVLDSKKSVAMQWRNSRIAQFFCGASVIDSLKTHRIELPHDSIVQWSISKHGNTEKILLTFQNLVNSNSKTKNDPLLMQEKDALQLKAGTLLQKNGIPFKTIAEGIMRIRNAPIHATYDSVNEISNLKLILDLLPGTTVQIVGSFKRSKTTKLHSTPIPESFHLSFQSTSTGFPHPIQYTGWALSGLLLPTYPHHLEQLPLFQPLYGSRINASLSLIPNGSDFGRAQHLLYVKEQVLEENRVELLKLHVKLCHAIVSAATEVESEGYLAIINHYFSLLENSTKPFNHLADTWQLINDSFVNHPYARLQQIWLERSEPDLFHNESSAIQQKARNIIQQEQAKALQLLQSEPHHTNSDLSQATMNFINCMRELLGNHFRDLILQSYSETLRCSPKMLDDLSQKLQLTALHQLSSFLNELTWDLESTPKVLIKSLIKQNIERQLQSNIKLFQAEDFDSIEDPLKQIIEEIEFYFTSVFFNEYKTRERD